MKKIILLFFILLGFAAHSQIWVRPNSTYGTRALRIGGDNVVYVPTGCGKPALPNATDSAIVKAFISYDSCANKLWVYNPKIKDWGAAGGGGGFASNGVYLDGDTIKLGGTYNAVMLTGANMWYNVVGSPPNEYTLNYQAPTSHNLTAGKDDRGGIFNVAPSEFKYVSQKPGDAQSQFKVDSVNLTFRDFSDNDKSDVIKVSIPDSSISIAKPAAAGGTFSILARDSATGKILQTDYGDFVVKQTQNPGATESPNYRLQRRVTDTTLAVNYGFSRAAATAAARATADIQSVVVDGISRTFSNPAPGGSGSGSTTITYTPNNTRTVNNVVTTVDGKTATASITINTIFMYYIGYSVGPTPTTAELWAGVNNFLPASNSRLTSGTLAAPTGARYKFFAFPSSLGTPTVKIGGFEVGYTVTPTSVTNTTGFTETYNVAVAPFASSAGGDYQIL